MARRNDTFLYTFDTLWIVFWANSLHFFIRITDEYEIPQGTFVFPNLYGIMHDENHFKTPETFDPQRFLHEEPDKGRRREGRRKTLFFQPDERVIPFSIGKRSCLGQTLAEKELFLFFTGLMQNFTFSKTSAADSIEKLPNYHIKATHPQGPNRPAPVYQVVLQERLWLLLLEYTYKLHKKQKITTKKIFFLSCVFVIGFDIIRNSRWI